MEMLPGYDDVGPDDLEGPGLAYDGSELLGLAGFWPAYLVEVLELDLDEELAGLFDVEVDVIRAAYRQLTDTSAWPVFPVELGGGGRIVVVYRNFAEDLGVDYLLVPAGATRCITLATVEGVLDGPGMSWPELTAVADRQATPVGRATALLLLAPILSDTAADPGDGVTRLADALRVVGVTGQTTAIAEAVVSEAFGRVSRR